MEVIEYAGFEHNQFWNYSSFIRCDNCERFCSSCSLSSFSSRLQNSRIRALRNFFGQEGHRPFKSEGAVRLWSKGPIQSKLTLSPGLFVKPLTT